MNIEQYLEELIKREGGYVNNPADRGGATKYGITEAVARANGFKGNMKDLPLDVAKSIYRKNYWTAPRFDQVNTVSSVSGGVIRHRSKLWYRLCKTSFTACTKLIE